MKVKESWIELRGIRLWGRHGVSPLEREVGSEFALDLRLKVRISPLAFEGDELGGTVSYADVYGVVRREFEVPSRLIEHVAWRVARAVLALFATVEAVEVSVAKVNPPIQADCRAAAVNITAIREDE